MRPHPHLRRVALAITLSALAMGCRNPDPKPTSIAPTSARTSASPFRPAALDRIRLAIGSAIQTSNTPGAVYWLEHQGQIFTHAAGERSVEPVHEPMSMDTIFDLASLTKVVATTPAVLLLIERARVDLDAPVQRYIPEFSSEPTRSITIRHLLTHTSGLRPDLDTRPAWSGHETAIRLACVERPTDPPGTRFRYSDINFILLGEVVERVTHQRLEEFVLTEVHRPLGMNHTRFLPGESVRPGIAPTEKAQDGPPLRGVVHDPTARFMGGVAGHAGLFSTAHDLARYARMLLNEGELDGVRLFKPETVRLMTSVQSPPGITARRGLGWDIDSPYSRPRGQLFPLGSYGHTGFTGTCLWIDPFSKSFWILLSNRVHPSGKGNVGPLQSQLALASAEAIPDFNFAGVPGALPPAAPEPATRTNPQPATSSSKTTTHSSLTLNGIDVLARDGFAPLKGLRIGLITNHSGQGRDRIPTIDQLQHAPGLQLRALFSPEHGIRGTADENINDSTDSTTGLPIHSLYGVRRAPSPDQLQNLDALVYDIQDVGCRFYTYLATLGNCMEAAAKAGIRFIVLDRVNPIDATRIEGPVHTGDSSFVAYHRIPLRHGMTLGELATMLNAEKGWNARLTVVRIEGWTRADWLDQTGLPWTNPSPNMRSLNAAMLYPGVGLLETAVSVGRGTDTPFEILGAPYVNERALAEALNELRLPGVRFMPIRFTPTASVHRGEPCQGVRIHVLDRTQLNSVDIGIALALTLQKQHPGTFPIQKLQTLLQQKDTLEAVRQQRSIDQIHQLWEPELAAFKRRRETFLLYP